MSRRPPGPGKAFKSLALSQSAAVWCAQGAWTMSGKEKLKLKESGSKAGVDATQPVEHEAVARSPPSLFRRKT